MSVLDLKKRAQTHRRWLVLGFSVALTIVTLYFVFRGIDRRIFAQLLAAQDRSLLVGASVFVLLQIILASERWRAILSALMPSRTPSMLAVQAVFYASIFFNCLPVGTIGGDVVRVWLARRFAVSVRQLVLSVLLDRVLTVGALIVLAMMTLPAVAHRLAVAAWFGGVAVVVVGAAGFLLLQPLERVLGRWRDQRLMSLLLQTVGELRHLVHGRALLGLCWALSSALCAAVAAYCIARSLAVGVGLVAVIAVMSIVTFVTALPISLAGWGVREVSVVALLGLLGVERETALLLSLEFGIIVTLMSLPGGAIWLTLREHPDIATPT